MQMFYAASTGGFYGEELHQDRPTDSVPVAHEDYEALLAAQAQGRCIRPGPDGGPVAMDAPAPTLEEARTAKAREIRTGYDTALSGVLAGADATATGVAVGSALMAVSDPEGLEYLVERLTARRVELEQALLTAQAAVDPVAAMQAIVVSYPT